VSHCIDSIASICLLSTRLSSQERHSRHTPASPSAPPQRALALAKQSAAEKGPSSHPPLSVCLSVCVCREGEKRPFAICLADSVGAHLTVPHSPLYVNTSRCRQWTTVSAHTLRHTRTQRHTQIETQRNTERSLMCQKQWRSKQHTGAKPHRQVCVCVCVRAF